MQFSTDFQWHVDMAGYALIERPAGTTLLTSGVRPVAVLEVRAKGSELSRRAYAPLAYRPGEKSALGLFREFAALAPTPENFLQFVSEWGLPEADGPGASMTIDRINELRDRLRIVAAALDTGNQHDAALCWQTMCWQMAPTAFTPLVDFGNTPHKPPVLQISPTTLYGAMLAQAFLAIQKRVEFRQCRQCPTWFPIGTGYGTKRQQFCTDRCRAAYNRQHLQQGVQS